MHQQNVSKKNEILINHRIAKDGNNQCQKGGSEEQFHVNSHFLTYLGTSK